MPCRSALQSATAPHQRDLRKGRQSREGCWYAITKCVSRREQVLTRATPQGFPAAVVMRSIQHLEDAGAWGWTGYVIMPDHVHLVVKLASGDLSIAINQFGKFTARQINSMLGRRGAFWQHGYYEHRLRSEEALWAHVSYLLENPVRAGLVKHWEDWPFIGAPRGVILHQAAEYEGSTR